MRVILDSGHGGEDPGAIGVNGFHEAALALIAAYHVVGALQRFAPGAEVVLTRWADVETSLEDRVAASGLADAFVSVHFNAAAYPSARGTETLYHPSSAEGRNLAGEIQSRLAPALGLTGRGLKARPDLYVLRHASCPAVLVEVAFITSPEDMELFDPRNRLIGYRKAGGAIAEAIAAWGRDAGLVVA